MTRASPLANRRAVGLVVMAMGVTISLGGCAGPPPDGNGIGSGSAGTAQSPLGRPTDDVVGRLTGADNGLELRKWLIETPPHRVAAAMAAHTMPVLDEQRAERLERNGLRLVSVSAAELDPLLEALGGAAMNVNGWHGQILSWRPLHEVPIGGGEGVTLAVDGRMRQFRGGSFALLARCWTVQMEDGPHLQLELIPAYQKREEGGGTDFRQLLGASKPQHSEGFRSMLIDQPLKAGTAYILTSEQPGREWMFSGAEALDGTPAPERSGAIGPDAVAPLTIGQLMLGADRGDTGRGMLIFLPRVPASLFPPGGHDKAATELIVDG